MTKTRPLKTFEFYASEFDRFQKLRNSEKFIPKKKIHTHAQLSLFSIIAIISTGLPGLRHSNSARQRAEKRAHISKRQTNACVRGVGKRGRSAHRKPQTKTTGLTLSTRTIWSWGGGARGPSLPPRSYALRDTHKHPRRPTNTSWLRRRSCACSRRGSRARTGRGVRCCTPLRLLLPSARITVVFWGGGECSTLSMGGALGLSVGCPVLAGLLFLSRDAFLWSIADYVFFCWIFGVLSRSCGVDGFFLIETWVLFNV